MTSANSASGGPASVKDDPPLDPSVHMRIGNLPRMIFEGQYTSTEYYRMIAQAAYYLAEHRGFSGGHELEDWLAAEHEINSALGVQHGSGAGARAARDPKEQP